MSQGTPIVGVRMPLALRVLIEEYLRQRDALPTVEPWTLSDFIITACRDKLAHLERSRKPGRRKSRARPAESAAR